MLVYYLHVDLFLFLHVYSTGMLPVFIVEFYLSD